MSLSSNLTGVTDRELDEASAYAVTEPEPGSGFRELMVRPDPNERESQRQNNGLIVQLVLNTATNATWIRVWDHLENHGTAFVVPADQALDAFDHPFRFDPRAKI